jgi:hypothetical protein
VTMQLKTHNWKTSLKRITLAGLSLYGALMFVVLVAQQFHLFNVRGTTDPRSQNFSLTPSQLRKYAVPSNPHNNDIQATPSVLLCKIMTLSENYPAAGSRVYTAFSNGLDQTIIESMLYAASINNATLTSTFDDCETHSGQSIKPTPESMEWLTSDEWKVLRSVFVKDADVINRVSNETMLNPRLIIGPIIGEQMRFFTSRRSTFKSYFEPLKIFAQMSKFSFGFAGIKPETAERIEQNLKNPDSPFYPGKEFENLLDYPAGTDTESERMDRITNTENHYWSYLYVALYLKQFEAQWQHAGYPIDGRPEILATLYNLGHNRSIPKSSPLAGGAPITEKTYTFGGLAYDFYWSGELQELFSYEDK